MAHAHASPEGEKRGEFVGRDERRHAEAVHTSAARWCEMTGLTSLALRSTVDDGRDRPAEAYVQVLRLAHPLGPSLVSAISVEPGTHWPTGDAVSVSVLDSGLVGGRKLGATNVELLDRMLDPEAAELCDEAVWREIAEAYVERFGHAPFSDAA